MPEPPSRRRHELPGSERRQRAAAATADQVSAAVIEAACDGNESISPKPSGSPAPEMATARTMAALASASSRNYRAAGAIRSAFSA